MTNTKNELDLINVEEYLVDLKRELEFGDIFGDYGLSFDDDIHDIIRDEADNDIDIYYSCLLDWVKGNDWYMSEVMKEGLVDTRDYDFYRHIQAAQYYRNEESIYENLENYLLYTFLNDLTCVNGWEEIPEDFINEIKNMLLNNKNDINKINDIYELADWHEIITEYKELFNYDI